MNTWHYNYTNELYHYGVPGMRWGKRKNAKPTSDLRKRYDAAKRERSAAYKEYSRAYDKYANNPLNAFTKKGDQRYQTLLDKAQASNDARMRYKAVRSERKKAIKKTHADINKKATFGEKFVYNDATRKRAAKLVVDRNMSISEANKKAKGEAIRNTGIILAAIGGISAAGYMLNK